MYTEDERFNEMNGKKRQKRRPSSNGGAVVMYNVSRTYQVGEESVK